MVYIDACSIILIHFRAFKLQQICKFLWKQCIMTFVYACHLMNAYFPHLYMKYGMRPRGYTSSWINWRYHYNMFKIVSFNTKFSIRQAIWIWHHFCIHYNYCKCFGNRRLIFNKHTNDTKLNNYIPHRLSKACRKSE